MATVDGMNSFVRAERGRDERSLTARSGDGDGDESTDDDPAITLVEPFVTVLAVNVFSSNATVYAPL